MFDHLLQALLETWISGVKQFVINFKTKGWLNKTFDKQQYILADKELSEKL